MGKLSTSSPEVLHGRQKQSRQELKESFLLLILLPATHTSTSLSLNNASISSEAHKATKNDSLTLETIRTIALYTSAQIYTLFNMYYSQRISQ